MLRMQPASISFLGSSHCLQQFPGLAHGALCVLASPSPVIARPSGRMCAPALPFHASVLLCLQDSPREDDTLQSGWRAWDQKSGSSQPQSTGQTGDSVRGPHSLGGAAAPSCGRNSTRQMPGAPLKDILGGFAPSLGNFFLGLRTCSQFPSALSEVTIPGLAASALHGTRSQAYKQDPWTEV